MSEAKKNNQSFEESLNELENIVRELEAGGENLDKSIKNYERGMKLVKACEEKLTQAKLKVEVISNKDANNAEAEEFKSE